jgi:hypothetical protein
LASIEPVKNGLTADEKQNVVKKKGRGIQKVENDWQRRCMTAQMQELSDKECDKEKCELEFRFRKSLKRRKDVEKHGSGLTERP